MKRLRFVFLRALLAVVLILVSRPSMARSQSENARPRVTQAVDLRKLVVLRGNVHPLARTEFDRGAAPDDLPLKRMLLVLQRAPEQEAALQKLLDEQQSKSSASYHQWLTPNEFGRQFGPADADIQIVTGWLASQGFQAIRVSAGKTVVEFSGTAGQVRNAFHTELHKFTVEGEDHWANAADPQIPVALAPVVTGIASLHNFLKKPMIHTRGEFSRDKATNQVRPLFSGSDSAGPFFAVGPADFAKIYNSAPLLTQAPTPVDGTGQSIAIVGRTNIDIQDVRDFRNLFGLPVNDPQIILNGPDPGIVSKGEETEADLDVEWAGAAAPGATVKFVISESTLVADGVDLSALYIIENNIAPVLSESFGACEAQTGSSIGALWEQAAAQGITVLIPSGDSGSAGCDGGNSATQGLAVSGIASTPFNVAVGGTDFDYTGTTQSIFWNPPASNDPVTLASALSYIHEVPLNASCARNGVGSCPTVKSNGTDLAAAGGGPSVIFDRPSWQTGTGTNIPPDNKRHLPDVSLFASSGANDSFYVVCQADRITSGTSCDASTGSIHFLGVGGTSASAPAFAAIMALVNQKTGQRQGNANYVLYKLAAQPGASCDSSDPATITNANCIFYDTTVGNISVACAGASPNCSKTTAGGFGILVDDPTKPTPTPAWTTTPGYDMATGLGTVNAANLVNNWSTASFTPSATVLTLNGGAAVSITHGQSVTVSATVTPGSPAPTGDVSLIATGNFNNGSNSIGVDGFTLSGGTAAGATNLLPGGGGTSYTVKAHYAGDGTYGASNSNAVSVTVAAESSKTTLSFVTFDALGNGTCHTAPISVAYGSPYILRVDVTSAIGTACSNSPASPSPTGTITLTDSNNPLNDFSGSNTATLNILGFLEDQPIQLSPGAHSLVAAYSGDNSFSASTSPADAITITKATTATAVTAFPASIASGGSVTLTATITTQSNGAAPTPTVQFFNGSAAITGTVIYTPVAGSASGAAKLTAVLTTTLSALPPTAPGSRRIPIPPYALWILACAATLLLLFLRHLPRERRLGYTFAGLLLVALLAAAGGGCGGGGGGGGSSAKNRSITATYSGDANYSTSTSPAASVTVQ